jgi:hypothetical protein
MRKNHDETKYLGISILFGGHSSINKYIFLQLHADSWSLIRARIYKPFKEPRNRFPALRPRTKTLFEVPSCKATQAGGIDSLESIPGLHKRFQFRALASANHDSRQLITRRVDRKPLEGGRED